MFVLDSETNVFDEIQEQKLFRRKVCLSVTLIVVVSLLTAVFISISRVNYSLASITKQFNDAMKQGNFSYATKLYNYGVDTANYYNKVTHTKIFSMGNTTINSYMEAISRVDGMDRVYEIFKGYYPDEYPDEMAPVYNSCITYKEARKACDNIADNVTDYQQACDTLDKIAADNPSYPQYVFLNCKLTCARKCKINSQKRMSILKELLNKYPYNTWLYSYEGALVYLDNQKYGEALKLCESFDDVDRIILRMKIYRTMGDCDEAIKLYDEYYDEDNPNEKLDNELMKSIIIKRGGASVFAELPQYAQNFNNCSDTTLYILQVAALESENGKKYSEITSFMNKNHIPQSKTVLNWDMKSTDVSVLFSKESGDLT